MGCLFLQAFKVRNAAFTAAAAAAAAAEATAAAAATEASMATAPLGFCIY